MSRRNLGQKTRSALVQRVGGIPIAFGLVNRSVAGSIDQGVGLKSQYGFFDGRPGERVYIVAAGTCQYMPARSTKPRERACNLPVSSNDQNSHSITQTA
jgi:hypothetical protein